MIRVLAFFILSMPLAASELYIFNWTDYLPLEIIQEFEQESGINVHLSAFESNEAMYTKLKILNSGGYDLAVPSTYFVSRMIKEKMLQKIQIERLKNIKNIDPRLQNRAHDPGGEYSVPYLFGFTLLAYNEEKFPELTGWKSLWKVQEGRPILMLDDMRESFAVALKSLGYSSNATDPAQIKQAYQTLLKLKPQVRLFTSEAPKQSFISEEVGMGMIYSGDLHTVLKENSKIAFKYPEEGYTLWLDSMVIPRRAKNVLEAHQFIDFILRPEISARIAMELGYSSPNGKSSQFLKESYRESPLINPNPSIISNGELLLDVGPAVFLYEDYWQRLKVY